MKSHSFHKAFTFFIFCFVIHPAYSTYECPDNRIKFVIASPLIDNQYEQESTRKNAREMVQWLKTAAESQGYGEPQLHLALSDKATKENYLSLLKCPNLEFFFNMSHSNTERLNTWGYNGIHSNPELALWAEDIKKSFPLSIEERDLIFATHSCNSFQGLLKVYMLTRVKAAAYVGQTNPVGCQGSDMISTKQFLKGLIKQNKSLRDSWIQAKEYVETQGDHHLKLRVGTFHVPRGDDLSHEEFNKKLLTPALINSLHNEL